MEDNGPQGVASLKPRDMVAGLCRGQLDITLLYIKYISCGPEGYILNTVELHWLEL